MKPDWEKLGAAMNSDKVLIGDVDCTVEKDLCSQYGVKGYPTIKYFTGATAPDGDKYEKGRSFEELKTFAEENLGPSCSPADRDLCSAEKLAEIEAAEKIPAEERAAEIASMEAEVKAANDKFTTRVAELQKEYQDLMSNKENTEQKHAPKLKLYRALAAHAAASGKKDEL